MVGQTCQTLYYFLDFGFFIDAALIVTDWLFVTADGSER